MKRSSLLAATLLLTFASAVMAADTASIFQAETDAANALILAHEKSETKQVLKTEPPAETATGCCACPPDPIVTGDVYFGPSNKYLFRGNNLSASGDFVIQGGIDLYYKEFTLSYWGNGQNRYSDSTYSRFKVNETDLILDYAVPYTLPYLDKLKFNIGTQYFAVDGINDTNEFYLKASYDTLLKPTLAVYWDALAATRAGLFYTASVSHRIDIERNLFALNLVALVSYNQRNPNAAYTPEGDGVYSDWHNFELTAGLDYTPTSHITITPSYQFSNALSGNARDIGIKEQNVFALKAMFAF